MNLTGTWKPYGRFANKERMITIQDQKITLGIGVASPNPKQTTVPFHSVANVECQCHKNKI